MFSFRFKFRDCGPMVDGELSLVEPSVRLADDVVHAEAVSAAYPSDRLTPGMEASPEAETKPGGFDVGAVRRRLGEFLSACPRGRQRADRFAGKVPAYHFWMLLDPKHPAARDIPVRIAGGIGLRVGQNRELELYSGHIGYHVYPPARGHHYAERACRLLLPLCRLHGINPVWITCNPDNTPSRRTCERLGAMLVDTVDIPRDHPFYARGERQKCRYRVEG